jgi:hypothetical protein
VIRVTNKQEKQCRVGSGTGNPCLRPAVVEVSGVSFCEACAREQEAYFAIGELTEKPRRLKDEESLVEMLERVRQVRRRRRLAGNHRPEAA